MPRIPYEQHLAQKAAARELLRRRGSHVESETDHSSIFSNSTYQTQYSHASSSPHLYSRTSSSSYGHNYDNRLGLHPRTVSGTSRGSLSSGIYSPGRRSPSPGSPLGYPYGQSHGESSFSAFTPDAQHDERPGRYLAPPRDTRKEDRARRRRAREERSTLLGRKYDSPLRSWLRWMAWKGWTGWTLSIALLGVGMLKSLAWAISSETYPWDWSLWSHRLIGEQMVWWAAVCFWVMKEGKRGGRSWRTQVTGVLTILLAPVSILPFASKESSTLPSTAMIATILLLNFANDILATIIFALSTLLIPSGKTMILAYLPAIMGYLSGKSLWLGGGIKGAGHFLGYVSVLVTAAAVPQLCYSSVEGNKLLDKMMEYVPVTSQIASQRLSIWFEGVTHHWPVIRNSVQQFCAVHSDRIQRHKLQGDSSDTNFAAALRLLVLLPPIGLMAHCSQVLRTASRHENRLRDNRTNLTSPTINLLPLTLLVTSIGALILNYEPHIASFPLLPISLLMALRGGSSDNTAGKDELWKVGTWLHILGIMSLVPLTSDARDIALSTAAATLWVTLIGSTPYALVPILLRQIARLSTPQNVIIQYAAPVEAISIRAVFGLAWFWAMKKLIEGAWAIGGLSSSSVKERGQEAKFQ